MARSQTRTRQKMAGKRKDTIPFFDDDVLIVLQSSE